MVGIISPELGLAIKTLDILDVPHLGPDGGGTIQTLPNSPHRDQGIMYAGDIAPQRLGAGSGESIPLSLSRFLSTGRFGEIIARQIGRDARETLSDAVNDFTLMAMSRSPDLICASVAVIPITDRQPLPTTVIALCYGGKAYSPQDLRALCSPNSTQYVDVTNRYGTHRLEPDAFRAVINIARIGGRVLAASGQLCIEYRPDEADPRSFSDTERTVQQLPLSSFVVTFPHTESRTYIEARARRASRQTRGLLV